MSAYLAYTSKVIQEWTLQRRNQLGGEASLIMKKSLQVIFHFWPHSSYGQLQSKVMCWGHPWVMFLLILYASCSDDCCMRRGGGWGWGENTVPGEPMSQIEIKWNSPTYSDGRWWKGKHQPAPPLLPWSSTVNDAHSQILHTHLQVVINSVLMCIYVSIKFLHIHRYTLHRAWHLIT